MLGHYDFAQYTGYSRLSDLYLVPSKLEHVRLAEKAGSVTELNGKHIPKHQQSKRVAVKGSVVSIVVSLLDHNYETSSTVRRVYNNYYNQKILFSFFYIYFYRAKNPDCKRQKKIIKFSKFDKRTILLHKFIVNRYPYGRKNIICSFLAIYIKIKKITCSIFLVLLTIKYFRLGIKRHTGYTHTNIYMVRENFS